MIILKDYPKKERLKNGNEVLLRPMHKEDYQALHNFFSSLPLEDRLFLKEDVGNPEVINTWIKNLDYSRIIPILAEINGIIIGDATLHLRQFGWSRHAGEIRVVTDAKFRRQGLGLLLTREIFLLAVRLKLEKIVAEMTDTQGSAINIFKTLGFKQEAVLKDYVMDLTGKKHNLVIMTHDVETIWDEIQNIIHDSFAGQEGEE